MHAICITSPSFLDFHFVAVFYVLVGVKKLVCKLLQLFSVQMSCDSILSPLLLEMDVKQFAIKLRYEIS